MRITTKIVWNMEDMSVIEHKYYEYHGQVVEFKGDGVAKDQLDLQNKLTQQQLTRQNALQDQATNAVSGDLSGNNGFSPELMAALQSQFQNQNTGAFQSAGANVRAALASKGAGLGDLPTGGDFTRGIAELEDAKASSQSQGLLGLGIQNLQQALSNKYNAANVLTGNAAQVGGTVGNFNSGANNALNTYVSAANQGFSNAFTSAFGGSLGKGLGSFTASAAGLGATRIPGVG